jgi:anti-anti-sigma factor
MISDSKNINGIHLIVIEGNMDVHTTPDFLEHVEGILGQGIINIVIDMKNVSFVSSYGLGSLATILRKVQAKNGAVKLAGLPDEIRTPFEVTGLYEKFQQFGNADDALKSFN